jgi:hypothetical protein
LARALGQGGELPGLWALWRRFVAPPLRQPQQARLLAWASALRWVELRPALLLHTSSAANLDALWADRALRPHLGQRLAGDLASIRSSDPARLQRALAARGYAVRAAASPQPDPAGSEMSLAAGDRWWLYTSSLIHRLLAERLGLAAPPGAVLAALQATLGPAEQAAAWAAADAAGAALHAAIDGPPDPSTSLPLEQVEQCLLAAIDANDTVRLVYWSPWQQETTERCVQPLALQWRGDHRYLLAHCHTANAPRTFRLDRILALTTCSPS